MPSQLTVAVACAIVTFVVHSKLEYCNSLYFNLCKHQINCFQCIQNYLIHATAKTPTSLSHLVLSLSNGPKLMNEFITGYCLLHNKVHTTARASYLYNLIFLQPPYCICTSFGITVARPATSSSLKITITHPNVHHHISDINLLLHSTNLVLINLLHLHDHHSHHPLVHSRLITRAAD